jgi:uncharacterized membrane protein YjfL (UPF0719 family)
MRTFTNTVLEWLQMNAPLGDHIIASVASGMRVLIALAVIGLCVVIRGRFNYHVFATKAERTMLTESNPAFMLNQFWIAVAFVFPVGAALMSTANIPAFVEKVVTALVIQIIAMVAIHILFRRVHRAMLNKQLWAGHYLGVITALGGLMNMFEILR